MKIQNTNLTNKNINFNSQNVMYYELLWLELSGVFLHCCVAKTVYRSGTANSNTVNSKFHLIRSLDQDFARLLSFHVLNAQLIEHC